MKSELITEDAQSKPTFPASYKSVTCGAVVLFTSTATGVVVKESRHLELGEFDDGFESCNDTEYWQRLPSGSQVVLTQD